MKLMIVIDRIAAWILVCCVLLYMLSGFDIQLRFLSAPLSASVHLVYLFPVAQTAFAVHTSYAIHLAFKRWKLWNPLGKCLLGLYLAVNAALFCLFFIIHL